MQMEIAKPAVSLLKSVEALQTTVRAPFEWANADDWREVDDYVDPENVAELKDEGERRRVRMGKSLKRDYRHCCFATVRRSNSSIRTSSRLRGNDTPR